MNEIIKKKICIILPGKLPVPNIMGGAIETLITLLIEQNEIQQRVEFIVISAWAEGVEEASKKYKNTSFYYIKIGKGFYKKAVNFINYIIAKSTGVIDFFKTPMHYDIEKLMPSINADAVVVEHGVYKHFDFLRKRYRRDQLYLHLHGTGPLPDRKTRETFGNVITVSEFVRDLYESKYTEDTIFKVCLNGIDGTIFKKKISDEKRKDNRKKWGIHDDDLLLIYTGRLVKEKGVKEVVRGVIDTKNSNIKLMIVGNSNFKDGKKTGYTNELVTMIEGHENQIFLTGYVPNNELPQYYQSADVQVICSTCEDAAPLVAIEGQMSNLPLLITNSGGLREYLTSKPICVLDKRKALSSGRDSEKLANDITDALNEYYEKFANTEEKGQKECGDMETFGAAAFYNRFVDTIT